MNAAAAVSPNGNFSGGILSCGKMQSFVGFGM